VQRGERIAEIGLQLAGGVMLAVVGLVLLPVHWYRVGHAIGARWELAAAAAVGVTWAGIGLWLAGRRRRKLRRWPLRALPWWFAALALAAVIAAGTIAVTATPGSHPVSGPGLRACGSAAAARWRR
jgi:hypothetical protein